MDRTAALWTLVAFFGATVVFGLVRQATKGESAGVALGAQVLTLAVIVGALVLVFRKRN